MDEHSYDIHGILQIRIRSSRQAYLSFFDQEFSAFQRALSDPDVELTIDPDDSPGPEESMRIKRLFRFRYAVDGLERQPARIAFWGGLVGRIMPTLAGPIAQTELLEAALYFKALEKGVLIFHASCISNGKEAYVIAAEGGTGKTTTVMRLLQSDSDGQFLGDDHVLVAQDMTAYSYPRPLHIFRSTLKDFPALNISGRIRAMIYLRFLVAALLSRTTGQRFYLATRVPIEAICPGTGYGPPAPLATVIALQREGGSRRINLHDVAERGAFAEHLLAGGEINQILWTRFLARRSELRAHAKALERKLLDELLRKLGKAYVIDRQAARQLTGIQSLKELLARCDRNGLVERASEEPSTR